MSSPREESSREVRVRILAISTSSPLSMCCHRLRVRITRQCPRCRALPLPLIYVDRQSSAPSRAPYLAAVPRAATQGKGMLYHLFQDCRAASQTTVLASDWRSRCWSRLLVCYWGPLLPTAALPSSILTSLLTRANGYQMLTPQIHPAYSPLCRIPRIRWGELHFRWRLPRIRCTPESRGTCDIVFVG